MNITVSKKPSMPYTLWKGLKHSRNRFTKDQKFPDIRITWPEVKIEPKHLLEYCRICDIEAGRTLPSLYPFTMAYPCMLRLLCQASFPFSIFKVLNTRTHTLIHQPISMDTALGVAVKAEGYRHVVKGIEFDLHTMVRAGDDAVWENTSTFFVRRTCGNETPVQNVASMPTITDGETVGAWYLPEKDRLRFARLSGDSNGIHYNGWYARMLGFKRDFAQPLRVTSKCMDLFHQPVHMPLVLDLHYKGPVYYNHHLSLSYQRFDQTYRFDVYCEGNPKPSICGLITGAGIAHPASGPLSGSYPEQRSILCQRMF
jgi:hypothetical protein